MVCLFAGMGLDLAPNVSHADYSQLKSSAKTVKIQFQPYIGKALPTLSIKRDTFATLTKA